MITSLRSIVRDTWTGAIAKDVSFPVTGHEINTSEIKVARIDGLGQGKSTVSVLASATDPGGTILNTRDETRNIVITLALEPSYADEDSRTSDLRDYIYRNFINGSTVELTFNFDNNLYLGPVGITGVVESVEAPIFMKDPQVQISIICADPVFRSFNPPTVLEIESERYFDINYVGTAPVGYRFQCEYKSGMAAYPSFRLHLKSIQGGAYFGIARDDIQALDRFDLSSVRNDRFAKWTRYSSTQNAMPWLVGSLTETTLKHGLNHFECFELPRMNYARLTYGLAFKGI